MELVHLGYFVDFLPFRLKMTNIQAWLYADSPLCILALLKVLGELLEQFLEEFLDGVGA